MMTSTPASQQHETDGRTVREVVECNQELVNEAWCRKIIRQLLQSLEMQYAMQLPHRPITPETVLVLDSGDPLLLPTSDSGAPGLEADDVRALAAVIHYAITREYPPAGPLRGRALGYNPAFLNAIDRCLAHDPGQRPQDIQGMRELLGIVPLGPVAAAPMLAPPAIDPAAPPVTPPSPPAPVQAATHADAGRGKRTLMLAGVAVLLCCGVGGLIALLVGADSRDALALAVPADAPAGTAAPAAGAPEMAVAPGADIPLAPADPAMPAVPGAPSPAATPAAAAQQGAVSVTQATAAIPDAAPNAARYKLLIKPWAMVVVDGVDHGASPPLKRLDLAPGPHTIRILNPNFPEHTVTVHAVRGETSVIELDLTEETIE